MQGVEACPSQCIFRRSRVFLWCLQVDLQQFAWTQRQHDAMQKERKIGLPSQPLPPVFCMQTALAGLYWSGLVYDSHEACTGKPSPCSLIVQPPSPCFSPCLLHLCWCIHKDNVDVDIINRPIGLQCSSSSPVGFCIHQALAPTSSAAEP